jgi:hypothetical protein
MPRPIQYAKGYQDAMAEVARIWIDQGEDAAADWMISNLADATLAGQFTAARYEVGPEYVTVVDTTHAPNVAADRPVGIEARCSKCDETFIPADLDDTVHVARSDGDECGGQGQIIGTWR